MDKKTFGNQDARERSRELTKAEKKRLERFEACASEMVRKGYRRVDLTVSIISANKFALFLLIPLLLAGFGLMFLLGRDIKLTNLSPAVLIVFMISYFVLVVLHELIHGVSWALFTPHHFKDIEFGFMKQYVTPYCTCSVPLEKRQYIFGALMPMVLLGILPMLAGILTGSVPVMLMGVIMTDAAAGDIMIVRNIRKYQSRAQNIVYMDHPTQAGGVIFEKDQ